MPLTNLETIKKIIQTENVFIPNVYNERVELPLFERGQLTHPNVSEASETVKIIRHAAPVADTGNPVTLNTGVPYQLDWTRLVWDTVVVADSLALTNVWIENLDFVIDYFAGTITIADPANNIADGDQVFVWYVPFTVLTRNDDYSFHYDEGQLNRRSGSSIPSNAYVYVDYRHADVTITDRAIVEAIAQAEAWIEPRLRPGMAMTSDDRGLMSAATHLTLYILCLSQSFKELNVAGHDISDDLAEQWHDLAEKYLTIANSHFSKYMNVTAVDAGGLIQNRFTTKRARTIWSPTVTPRRRKR
jgi:hypothetical protein